MALRPCAFFSPRLHPVLDRGKGHEDPVVAPQMPTRRAVGQAVLDHETDGQIDHAMGILTTRWGQIREVGVEVLATLRTEMLRIRDAQIPRTPPVEIAQVMQRAMNLLVPIGRVTTARTRLPCVVTTVGDALGRGQVGGGCNPFTWVGAILSGSEHRVVLLAQRLGPDYTIRACSGEPGMLATVSELTGFTWGVLGLVNKDGGLDFNIHPQLPKGITLPLGQGISGWAVQTGTIQNIPDVTQHPRYFKVSAETTSELAVPLKLNDVVIGVLDLQSSQPAAFTNEGYQHKAGQNAAC